MWRLRRRRGAPDHATAVAAYVRELARTAALLTTQSGRLAARELALREREARLEDRLRRESEVLDERRDALAGLGRDLAARERRIDDLEQRAGELAEFERDSRDRESRLVAEELAARRRADELHAAERHLDEQLEDLKAREARLRAEELSAARSRADPAPALPPHSGGRRGELGRCVLFVPSPEGYRLVPLELEPPRPGETVEVAGEPFGVLRVGPSPLPGDERRCVFLAA